MAIMELFLFLGTLEGRVPMDTLKVLFLDIAPTELMCLVLKEMGCCYT